jgi:hypothetical protein
MRPKRSLFPVVTLIVGIILGLILMLLLDVRLGQISPNDAGKKVKDLYELSTGANIEIMSVLKESGMYKVILRTTDINGNSNIIEVFVTQDGKILSQNVLKIDEFVSSLNKQKEFIDCLSQKGLKIYGVSNTTATQLQLIQILGGSRFLSKIYVDCVGSNLQVCLDAGVATVPSIGYQGKIYEGVKTLDWFKNTTSCVYER